MFTMILLNALLKRQSGELSSFFSEYLQFALLVVGTIFYIDVRFKLQIGERKRETVLPSFYPQNRKKTLKKGGCCCCCSARSCQNREIVFRRTRYIINIDRYDLIF